jgi:hypothetical protein
MIPNVDDRYLSNLKKKNVFRRSPRASSVGVSDGSPSRRRGVFVQPVLKVLLEGIQRVL